VLEDRGLVSKFLKKNYNLNPSEVQEILLCAQEGYYFRKVHDIGVLICVTKVTTFQRKIRSDYPGLIVMFPKGDTYKLIFIIL
jgi:hypothetical protein